MPKNKQQPFADWQTHWLDVCCKKHLRKLPPQTLYFQCPTCLRPYTLNDRNWYTFGVGIWRGPGAFDSRLEDQDYLFALVGKSFHEALLLTVAWPSPYDRPPPHQQPSMPAHLL